MEIPSGEDAWGDFKSTTEQGDSVGSLSTMAEGLAEADERDEGGGCVVHEQHPEAEQPESAAGGKEDEHDSADMAVLAGPAVPRSAAAEVREEPNEMMAVKAAQSPRQPPQQLECCADDNNTSGESGVDLLNLLPSPTTAGSGANTGGENLDLFGSMLAPAPENPIHKLPAANSSSGGPGAEAGVTAVEASHQGDPTDGLRGASVSSEGEKGGGGDADADADDDDDGEWGVFEQPRPEDGDPTPAAALAAEKVDGDWIDLVGSGSGSDRAEEGNEGLATAMDSEELAPKPSELEPSLPSEAAAGKAEGGGDEGNVPGAGEGGSPSAEQDAPGVVAVDVLDWGDFGGPAAAVEATAGDGAAAASPESVDGAEPEGQATEEEDASRSASPDAAGVAAVDVLDWGDFGGPVSAVEATVGGADAAASDSVDGKEQEGQAKEDEDPSDSAVPDANGMAATDVLDWGDFGGPNPAAVEATADETAESADGHAQGEQAKEAEVPIEEEEEDEWSAFEAPPTPSAAQSQDVVEPLPRAADENLFSADFAPPAVGSGVEEESKDGSPESPPPTQAKAGAGGSGGLATSDAGEAGDKAADDGQQPSEAVVPPAAAPAVEWGFFGAEETTEPSPEEPPAERADGDDKTPPRNDEQALPSTMPELVGGTGEDEDGSSSWTASAVEEEAPAAVVAPTGEIATEGGGIPASAAGDAPTVQADEQVAEASAAAAEDSQAAEKGVATKEADAPPAAEGAEADAVEVEGDTGGGGGVQEPEESDDDWGSDFGDFEEAPTTDDPEPVTTTAAPPAVVAFPKPPVSDARSLPAVGAAVGAGGAAAATVQEGKPNGTADTTSGDARDAADGGASPSPLAAMVAVFDEAFGGAAAATTSRKVPSVSGGAEEGDRSLDSLADLAHLLAHATPSRRRAPARLNEWAKSCILRGIRPVPDALALQEDDESDQGTGRSGSARGHGSVGVGIEAQPSSTPTASSPRASAAVEARQPGAAVAERPASSSPLASAADLGRSSSAKTSPRAVSPSRAPRPLPRKASATVEPPPRAEPVASPPAVVGQSASAATKASPVVSPSSSPPPLPRKPFPVVEPPLTEPAAGQPQPADTSSDKSKDAAVVEGQAGLEATATAATVAATTTMMPAVIESEGASTFAAFPASPEPAGENAAFDEDEFVWSEPAAITPEMPRHPPPRVPMTPPDLREDGGGFNEKEGGNDSSTDVIASADGRCGGDDEKDVPDVGIGGESAASAEVDADGGGGDDDDWSDDPFDSFQSAPLASSLAPPPPPSSVLEGSPLPATTAVTTAADRTSSPSPPAEASPWNLDFLMAAPATGGAGEGRVLPTLCAGFGAGVSSAGEGGQSGKPLDLVSQALAGFGIAASASPDSSQAEGGNDVFSAFSEGGGAATGAFSHSSNIQGTVLIGGGGGGGGGGLKGDRDRVSSVDVSDLLRATRLRGGGRRASRPTEALSAAAEARLAALPDLSYMLSHRIRFPMRAAEPLPATATGEGFL